MGLDIRADTRIPPEYEGRRSVVERCNIVNNFHREYRHHVYTYEKDDAVGVITLSARLAPSGNLPGRFPKSGQDEGRR